MDKSRQVFLLRKKGQGVVEYLLLLLVISSLLFSILRSRAFQDFIGEDSVLFQSLLSGYQYSYRHGTIGRIEDDTSTYTDNHDSYVNTQEGGTRFFTPRNPYPN